MEGKLKSLQRQVLNLPFQSAILVVLLPVNHDKALCTPTSAVRVAAWRNAILDDADVPDFNVAIIATDDKVMITRTTSVMTSEIPACFWRNDAPDNGVSPAPTDVCDDRPVITKPAFEFTWTI